MADEGIAYVAGVEPDSRGPEVEGRILNGK
jgi:hypothetical protein